VGDGRGWEKKKPQDRNTANCFKTGERTRYGGGGHKVKKKRGPRKGVQRKLQKWEKRGER